mgnify:CR=1 FL=1|jgi:hypothetical protein
MCHTIDEPRAARGQARAWLTAFLAAPQQTDECLLWPFGRWTNGYGRVGDKGVHAVVCEHSHGPRPPGMEACHSHTGNKHCINPRHLRWGTRQENAADTIAHGTSTRGVRNPNAKLSDAQVADIRRRYASGGVRQEDLAREVGVSQVQVSRIVRGKLWEGDGRCAM